MLPVVLYGCETLSLSLGEELRFMVSENRVLRRICAPRREKVTENWRKLHNKELRNLYSSSDIIGVIKSGRMRWRGHITHIGEM